MKFSKLYIFLFALTFLHNVVASAQVSFIEIDTTEYMKLRIDPMQAQGAMASDIFSSITYIPLETTAESVFGSVSQIEVVKDYFIILDYNTNCILIFHKNGKFHKKFKGKRETPIWRFSVNRWSNQIVFSNDYFKSIMSLDFDLNVVRIVDISNSDRSPIFASTFQFLSASQILSYDQYRDFAVGSRYYNSFSRSLLRFATDDGMVDGTTMCYSDVESKIDVLTSGHQPLTNSGIWNEYLFSKPYSYDIYKIGWKKTKLDFKLVFPLHNSLPSDFLSNPIYSNNRGQFLKKNRDLVFSINNIYRVGDNLLFEASSFTSNRNDNLIYNLKTGLLVAYKFILPDKKSSFLPLYDDLSGHFENYGISACDGTSVFTTISSVCLFRAKQDNSKLKIQYPGQLENYLSRSNSKGNPVVVQLEFQ